MSGEPVIESQTRSACGYHTREYRALSANYVLARSLLLFMSGLMSLMDFLGLVCESRSLSRDIRPTNKGARKEREYSETYRLL